jgi:hypothetical protein
MDLRGYYRKMRQIESEITEPYVVLVSLDTPDGGKAGVRTEVPRHLAAKLIAEGWARLADALETRSFMEENLDAKHIADQLAAANRMQVMVVPANELRPKTAMRQPREQA